MSFKAFSENEIIPAPIDDKTSISISEDSPCASHIHLFTGIRSLGKINFYNPNEPAPFGLIDPKEIQYKWAFDNVVLEGQDSLSAKITDGVFISTADQNYRSSTNSDSIVSHQNIFRHSQGYLYREDVELKAGAKITDSLFSSSSAGYETSVIRQIVIRRDLLKSGISPTSFRLQLNNSNTSITGAVSGPSANEKFTTIANGIFGSETPNLSAYTIALDIKNPYGGVEGTSKKSFFGVKTGSDQVEPFELNNGMGYTAFKNLDSINNACTIEAIIRPFRTNSTIYFRRLSNPSYSLSKDQFMKLELTTAPDGSSPAFRFSIRSATADGEFVNEFAVANIQASGLFIPNDVGINLFDGSFHHIVATWDTSEIINTGSQASAERGAGIVMGYIDGYKLQNKEQVFPRLSGSDAAEGPAAQANMLENRIPIRTSPLYDGTLEKSPSGNNVYIGTSNYNRNDGDTKGDRGELAGRFDAKLDGFYDGQIQHLRLWNQRLKDGTTGYNTNIGRQIFNDRSYSSTGSLLLSFQNFKNSALTSSSASNIAAWWEFNIVNSITAVDIAGGLSGDASAMQYDPFGNLSSNTGSVIGNSSIKIFDSRDITLGVSGNTISDTQMVNIPRDFLYFDQPVINKPIKNFFNQGRLSRNGIDGSQHTIGVVFYDLGITSIDSDDIHAKMQFTLPTSGTTGDYGFAVSGHLNTSINLQRVSFNSISRRGRLLLNAVASGTEMNYAGNPTGINNSNKESVFDDPTTFISSVGLYNHNNDLLAVAKLAKPIKKDETINLTTQISLDF